MTLLPGAHAKWEEGGDIEDLARIATAADRLGYDHLTCSEHVVVPVDVAPVRGSRYWDPLATFGYLAAVTERIRLATAVLVLAYHHPLAIAKRYGTLDQVSGGRLVLGVGVGTLAEEFEILGVPFADRGSRADDALRALRASLSQSRPRYEGEHYRYSEVVLDPSARPEVPIWVGGRTGLSLRRAVRLADGWCPFGLRADEVAALLQRASSSEDWGSRAVPLDVVLQNGRPFDPAGDPDGVAHAVDRLVEAGATGLQLRLVHRSRDHYIEQLEAFVELMRQSAGRDA
ncbi:MAG TPA: LLM class F420-dependent oxidoreductase, partial [Acidimicrobiales bacterium]|nr:LLM class F420-dependent oxidoreductase [Acidimicrobiales bacterium]